MTITGLSSNQTAAMSLVTGTTYESSTSVNDVLAQGQGTDSTTISKGGQQMSQLQKLATSDPAKFKEAAQKISDELAEKAKSTSDSHEASMLSDMSSKFASAAKSGDMSSLKPSAPPANSTSSSKQSSTFKFKGSQSGSNPMATVDSVVSGVLSDLGSSTSSSSSSSSSSVSATSDTAA